MRAARLGVTLLLIGFWGSVAVHADRERSVQVEVWAVRATKKNEEVSKELKGLAKALAKQFKYTGFTLVKKVDKKVELGKPLKADLLDGYAVAVTPREREGRRIKLQLHVTKRDKDPKKKKPKTVLKTTLTTRSGPFVPLGCGSLSGGDYLILLVRAR